MRPEDRQDEPPHFSLNPLATNARLYSLWEIRWYVQRTHGTILRKKDCAATIEYWQPLTRRVQREECAGIGGRIRHGFGIHP
jgi:hypothetical protein